MNTHMNTPKILFKYLDHRGLDLLTNRRVLATPPNKLNDPLEFTPIIDDNPTDEEIWGKISHPDYMRELWEGVGRRESYEIFQQRHLEGKELLTAEHRKLAPEVTESYRQEFIESTGAASGLVCFSRRNDGILLWSHYADGHKGFVVGFGVPQLVNSFGREDGTLVEVVYSETRPNMGSVYSNVEDENIRTAIIRTKSPEWKYEEEYRLIILREKFRDDENKGKDDRLFWSIKGNESVVRSVIIGSRCEPEWKSKLASVLAEPAYQHVEIFEAIPDKKSFAIYINPAKLR